MKFNKKLEALLKSNPDFIDKDTGGLFKSKVIDAANTISAGLIELLLKDNDIKNEFFTPVKGALIFNTNHFASYVKDKNFLNHSYTEFNSEIRLSIDNTAIKKMGEVSLVFPYKDCVLEGGQTREEKNNKRGEIFFNKVLAKDEINKLLAPKVLTKFSKWDNEAVKTNKAKKVNGFNRNKDGMITDNLLIKGNNLLALHTLKSEFAGKVKLIYIDPPYNTGTDGFNYNDSFNHSTWLTFMKNRLEAAKDLLSDDGAIFVQIDEEEGAYLKVLMDEIFGRDKFVNQIIWRYRTYQGQVKAYFPKKHDMIYWYNKNRRPDFKLSYQNNYEDTVDFKRWKDFFTEEGDIIYPNYPKTDSRFKDYLKKYINENGQPKKGDVIYSVKGYVVDDVWEDIKALDAKNKTERTSFRGGQKPEALIQRILHSVTGKKDLVLDFHSGSGTTLAAAHKMGRQWIGIEQMDYIKDLPETRLKKVIKGEPGGISKSVDWKGGGEFIYCEMAVWNQRYIDGIQKITKSEALYKLWDEIKNKGFILYNIDVNKFEEEFDKFKKLPIKKQKDIILNFLDMNMLYVPLSESKDKTYNISLEEQKLNRQFYSKIKDI